MKSLIVLTLLLLAASGALADDLYEVLIGNETSAALLREAGVEPVYRLNDGYLVLAGEEAAEALLSSGLETRLVARAINKDQLAVDQRFDRQNIERYNMIYEAGDLRILQLPFATAQAMSATDGAVIPIDNRHLNITYREPANIDAASLLAGVDLWTLIGNVNQDTITSYLNHLQAYDGRLAGTTSNFSASQWIRDKFQSYGYTDTRFQYFTGSQLWDRHDVNCRNVIAVKPGTRYPNLQIVIGAHHDAVPDSPGADDNGSGTVGVLEMARILADIETDVTFVFVTFDSEESGLIGSEHYVDEAVSDGDNIMFMFNMDMIGHYENTNRADLHYGPDQSYAQLWDYLADSLVGIDANYAGSSGNSDHAPFVQAGFDVAYASEYIFSDVYHTPQDSTTYVNFDYMTRMIKASLATVYTANRAVPQVVTTAAHDGGDGQSVEVHWEPGDLSRIDHYEVHWTRPGSNDPYFDVAPGGSAFWLVEGLTEGQEYLFYVLGVDAEGVKSVTYNSISRIPLVVPVPPENLAAEPMEDAVHLWWDGNNTELDFNHYAIIRDGSRLPDLIYTTSFIDSDPALGSNLHDYYVIAVDDDGFASDTTGISAVTMRAATFDEGRILAVSRTGRALTLSDSSITEDFLLEALDGLDFDYMSDPCSHGSQGLLTLVDMIAYEVVVIGGESGKGYDDIGGVTGNLEDIVGYLNLGGKVMIFGRWGDITLLPSSADTMTYNQQNADSLYYQVFNTYRRVRPLTALNMDDVTLETDFVGAHSQISGYPSLYWDSAATALHSVRGIYFKVKAGIPCPSFPILTGSGVETIYTYDSNRDSTFTEGRTIGWRSIGGSRKYVFFDVPLSFMERSSAVLALQMSLQDLGIDLTADRDSDGVLDLEDNCPAEYNPGQEDADFDDVGDLCDACPGHDDNVDSDDDGTADGCDICPGHSDLVDADTDGIPNGCDNCPLVSNAGQDDSDSDSVGDSCDVCAGHDDMADSDGDAVPDGCDVCPGFSDQVDSDSDGVPNGCDNCPTVANIGQDDNDGDTVGDSCDVCAGFSDLVDADSDGVPDGCDICAGHNDNVNSDSDTIPNGCDNCPYVANPGQEDEDEDGTGDACEPSCCGQYYAGFTGNCNCSTDGKITLGDITVLIDRVYISKEPLCCEENANVNGSVDGKLTLSDITNLIDHVYISHGPTAACQ